MSKLISCKKLTHILNESGFWPEKPFNTDQLRNKCVMENNKVFCFIRFKTKPKALNFCKYVTDVHDLNCKHDGRSSKVKIQVTYFKQAGRGI